MARHLIRALGGIALAGACLALAACTSSGSSGAGGAAKADGVPVKNGTVTVKEGNKVLCVMTVVNGKGTCKVPASTVGAGTKTIVGDYAGTGHGPAQSAPVYLSVIKARTSAALSVSPAKVTYGDEQVARVTVRVTAAAHAGTPTGSVLVRSGATTICTIKLSQGAGSCTLGARQLKAGSPLLTASYPGDQDHYSSGSPSEKVTVVG
jgi:hypothetical protein